MNSRIETADVLGVDAAVQRSTGAQQFGITKDGFLPKPFARLLAEKLALARGLFGDDLDLTSGSAIRKLLEISALEDARTWAALASMYDNLFVTSATGDALSALGAELGLPRPHLEARGAVKLTLSGALPAGVTSLTIPRGARITSAGGHQAETGETVVLSAASPQAEVAVTAFYPGPEHNLDPAVQSGGEFPQKLDRFNREHAALAELLAAEQAAHATLVKIEHTQKLSGGELFWPDARYRDLLLRAPRSIWSVDAIRTAVLLVPGVRQAMVRDGWGGLDLHQSIFGDFNFIERVFSSERDLGSPYYFNVLVAKTAGAIWGGPDGLQAAVESAIEDLRPIGIFPRVTEAVDVGVGVAADLVIQGLPLPTGARSAVNASLAAKALKEKLTLRLRRYVEGLGFGEPVRSAEVIWTLMNEPGVADVKNLKLLRFPPAAAKALADRRNNEPDEFPCPKNVEIQVDQIAVFVDAPELLNIA